MKYLVIKKPGEELKHYQINPGQESRINTWFKKGNVRPKKFTLDTHEIETEHILGFTDDLPAAIKVERPELGKGYEAFKQIGAELRRKHLSAT